MFPLQFFFFHMKAASSELLLIPKSSPSTSSTCSSFYAATSVDRQYPHKNELVEPLNVLYNIDLIAKSC
jgi:hypothetical protein